MPSPTVTATTVAKAAMPTVAVAATMEAYADGAVKWWAVTAVSIVIGIVIPATAIIPPCVAAARHRRGDQAGRRRARRGRSCARLRGGCGWHPLWRADLRRHVHRFGPECSWCRAGYHEIGIGLTRRRVGRAASNYEQRRGPERKLDDVRQHVSLRLQSIMD